MAANRSVYLVLLSRWLTNKVMILHSSSSKIAKKVWILARTLAKPSALPTILHLKGRIAYLPSFSFFFCCERLSASMARSLRLELYLYTAVDSRPGPEPRQAVSPKALRPWTIPLRYSVGSYLPSFNEILEAQTMLLTWTSPLIAIALQKGTSIVYPILWRQQIQLCLNTVRKVKCHLSQESFGSFLEVVGVLTFWVIFFWNMLQRCICFIAYFHWVELAHGCSCPDLAQAYLGSAQILEGTPN